MVAVMKIIWIQWMNNKAKPKYRCFNGTLRYSQRMTIILRVQTRSVIGLHLTVTKTSKFRNITRNVANWRHGTANSVLSETNWAKRMASTLRCMGRMRIHAIGSKRTILLIRQDNWREFSTNRKKTKLKSSTLQSSLKSPLKSIWTMKIWIILTIFGSLKVYKKISIIYLQN